MRKLIYILVGLVFILLGKDVANHYLIFQSIQAYVEKNSNDLRVDQIELNLWPLGGANVTLTGVHIDKESLKLDVPLFTVRTPLQSLKRLQVDAQHVIVDSVLQIDQFKGDVVLTQENDHSVLKLSQGQLENAALNLDRVKFFAEHINLMGHYIPDTKALVIDGALPDLKINELKGMSINTHVSLTFVKPVEGKIDMQMRGSDQLLDALVAANLIKPKELPLLQVGVKLFSNANEEIPLTIRFTGGSIYLGPIKLQ